MSFGKEYVLKTLLPIDSKCFLLNEQFGLQFTVKLPNEDNQLSYMSHCLDLGENSKSTVIQSSMIFMYSSTHTHNTQALYPDQKRHHSQSCIQFFKYPSSGISQHSTLHIDSTSKNKKLQENCFQYIHITVQASPFSYPQPLIITYQLPSAGGLNIKHQIENLSQLSYLSCLFISVEDMVILKVTMLSEKPSSF